MKMNISYWIKFSLFNLLLVAALGLLMRYKIAFELPFLNQKNIQHSHSHFAFSGWVSQTLFVLMLHFLQHQNLKINLEKYKKILIANLLCAYVMLISFIFYGYNLISIVFSTLTLLVSFWFAYLYFKDLKLVSNNNLAVKWFKAGLFFNVISSLGTFGLAYMMATKNVPQDLYLSSIYYYLHFQYNGWFWFACMGLFLSQLTSNITIDKINNIVFWLFFTSCIPAYLLSVLWLKMPIWVYSLSVLSAVLQLVGWFVFVKVFVPYFVKNNPLTSLFKWIYVSIIVCVTVKLFLQLGSTVPFIGKLAFGFRPIVIAYLHLVLLAIISSFLLVFVFTNNLVSQNKLARITLLCFIIGIFLNEFVLGMQGVASFSYTLVPYVNEMLFGVAIILFSSMFMLVYANNKKQKKTIKL